jgi:hypothetical protein
MVILRIIKFAGRSNFGNYGAVKNIFIRKPFDHGPRCLLLLIGSITNGIVLLIYSAAISLRGLQIHNIGINKIAAIGNIRRYNKSSHT